MKVRRRPPEPPGGGARGRLEVWAGVECSYNRVGDRYFDQLVRSGAYARIGDPDRLADLGVRTVRFPVLWERYAAFGEEAWRWVDRSLERFRARAVTPILGLLHHGSGPPHTHLLDPQLPTLLAAFARRVAERYPWVTRYTPINEPLTTARFSVLYGHWFPHARSPGEFARAMINQIRGIAAAMRAIREVTPSAELIQTEDLGRTYARRPLRYQADFENERRWLTFDLLVGRVRGRHPLAGYLRWCGIGERELEELAEEACPPDLIGVNHYLTSERFLDDRIERYPVETHGGNQRHRYADVEAVRVLREGPAGPYALLREAWERYRLPLAVTEAHLGCTREDQMRWLDDVWSAAWRLRDEGADVRAVTAWSAFGAFDWPSLLTRVDGMYEPGLFDVRGPRPRATALATMVRGLATSGSYAHPVLHVPGWWQRDRRLTYAAVSCGRSHRRTWLRRNARAAPPLLIVGAAGTLGRGVVRACDARGLPHRPLARAELDIARPEAVEAALAAHRPWAVVNCAGFVRVDDAELERDACRRANVEGAATLARACAEAGARFVTFSTDLVFDGEKRAPYVESDPARPLCEYGRSKADAESCVLTTAADALVIRTAAFFGDDDEYNFVTLALRALAAGVSFPAISDVVVSPTYVPELADATLDLLIDGERGVWHLASAGAVTWAELARRAARAAGVSARSLCAVSIDEVGPPAPRPRYSALESERGTLLGPLERALARYIRTRAWERVPYEGAHQPELELAMASGGRPDNRFDSPRGPRGTRGGRR